MKRSFWAIFASCAMVGLVGGHAATAEAWSVRQNASFCFSNAPYAEHMGNGVVGVSTTASTILACPVIDTSATPKTGVTSLIVHGQDNSTAGSVQVRACINYDVIAGGNCGAPVSSSAAGTGDVNLSPPRTFWTDPADFPYLNVVLPPKQGAAAGSFLKGYSFSG